MREVQVRWLAGALSGAGGASSEPDRRILAGFFRDTGAIAEATGVSCDWRPSVVVGRGARTRCSGRVWVRSAAEQA